MANRSFENTVFWDRVNQAVKESGMSKIQIADLMGVERKALSSRGDKSSWHSGRLASFCRVVGVSSDWLLGLSDKKSLPGYSDESISFRVINIKTGKEPIFDHNHLFKEKWFKESGLIWCDLEGWLIGEDGTLYLADECGHVAYAPMDKYQVIFE